MMFTSHAAAPSNRTQARVQPRGVLAVSGQAILNWTAAASPPANGYAVYWTAVQNIFPGTQRSTVAAGVVTKTLTGLPAGTVYFRVTAIHGRRESWHLSGSAVIT